MADEKKDNNNTDQEVSSKAPEVKIRALTWIIMLTVIALLSGSGFVLGRLMADFAPSDTPAGSEQNVPQKTLPPAAKTPVANQGTWYYNDLESVVVNPDEPGATRFVRVGLILEMSEEVSQESARSLIEAKKPLLINWLNLYFKSLSLSQMEDEKDMNRILSQVCDGFNETLFPDTKPQIKKILIREFNIQ